MEPLEKIRKRLEGYNLRWVARESGVHYETIYRIARGETENPSYETVAKILEVLNREVTR